MDPEPKDRGAEYRAAGKLMGKAALISGGDSGIGRSVAVLFAKEGADVAIVYLNEHSDAEESPRLVEAEGKQCLLIAGALRRRYADEATGTARRGRDLLCFPGL